MKIILLALSLLSLPAMANKEQFKHYKLTEEESETPWRYYYKQKLAIGPKNNKIKIEKCFAMHITTGERLEIPCSELDKIKPTLDLREIDGTDISGSAI